MPIPNRILFASCLSQVCPLQSQQLLVEESPVSSYNALTLAVTFCMLIQGKRFLETCIGCLLPIRYCLIVWSGVLACGGESSFSYNVLTDNFSRSIHISIHMWKCFILLLKIYYEPGSKSSWFLKIFLANLKQTWESVHNLGMQKSNHTNLSLKSLLNFGHTDSVLCMYKGM